MSSKVNAKVYMDVQIGASGAGRIVFELFRDLTPKTAQNFRGLCTGQYGKTESNVKLCYLGSKIHRIVDGFVIQGGDITNMGGKGGFSIYGRTFADQNFARTHSCAGLLSMANCGRNTNSSQFFITLKPCPHLDGKHVVFGQVISGMQIVKQMSKVAIDKEDKPRLPIIIIDCGQIGDFKGFLKYDPFKKDVFEEIRETKQKIIKDQHMIRKLLSEGLDSNEAYEYKKRLQASEKNMMELNKRQKQLQAQNEMRRLEGRENQEEDQREDNAVKQPEQQKIVMTEKMKQRLGEVNVNRLLDLKLKINQAKVLNSKAALEEQIRQNDINYHKMIKKQEWQEKMKNAQIELEAKGLSQEKLYLNRNALKKDQQEKVHEDFGWNVYGEEAYYKAYDKRCQALQKNDEVYEKQVKQQGVFPSYKPPEDALNRLALDVTKQQQKRNMFSRRRIYDEDETVTYINDRNRVYNQKLERNFGVYASGTKTALEMNSQK